MTHAVSARVARVVAGLEIPALLLIAPALLFPSPARLSVLAIVPAIWLCARRADGRAVPLTPMNVPLWILLGMVGVSLFVTYDVRLSLGKVSGVVLGVLLFWAVARWVTTPARLACATATFVAAGAMLAVIALLGTNWDNKIAAIGAVTSRLPKLIRGLPGAEIGFSSNAVAGCLVLFIPLQVALLRNHSRPRNHSRSGSYKSLTNASREVAGHQRPRTPNPESRTTKAEGAGHNSSVISHTHCSGFVPTPAGAPAGVQAVLLVLTAGTLVLTESRGAWFGLLVAIFAVLVWHARWTRLVAAVGAAVAAGSLATLGYQRVFDFIVSRSGPALMSTLALREEIWIRALRGIQDFPLTGMGMNTFRKLMPIRYPGYPYLPGEEVPHAHNHLLQAALDLGLPGLAAYAALWGIATVLLVRVYRHAEPSARAAAAGLGAGLIAHFVFSMTDAIPLGAKVGVLFWLALSLVVALHQAAPRRREASRASTT